MPNEAAYTQYRVFAESYVLQTIAQFDARAQRRLMKACEGAPYATADEALNDFAATESITAAQVEWIERAWHERKDKDPNADPAAFAAEVAGEVFSEIDF